MAIGIAAFCLLAIFALLPLGVTTNKNSINSTIAAGLAASIAADLRAVPRTGASQSPLYNLNPTATDQLLYLGEDGSKKNAAADADYLAKITITPPTGIGPTNIDIQICQPAAAANPAVAFEAVTSIDRNFP